MKHHGRKKTLREKHQALQKIVFGMSFRIALCSIVLLFAVLYVVKLNSVSTKGFVMADLERTIGELEQESEDLSVKISTYRSMNSIQERLSTLNFVDAGEVKFVEVHDGVVVRR